MTPIASIIIPVFNGEKYIIETLKSISVQSMSNFEVIVINDGSTDTTKRIVEEYAIMDHRVRLISRNNEGMAASLNFALKLAKSNIIVRIDADDLMTEDRLEKQLTFLRENPSVSVASSYVYLINSRSKVIGTNKSRYTSWAEVQKTVVQGKPIGIPHPGVIAKKQTLIEAGGYRGQFWPSDDVDLWTRLAEQGAKILIQPEFLTYYRIHSSSVSVESALKARQMYRWVRMCQKARAEKKPEPSIHEFNQYMSNQSLARKFSVFRHDYAFLFYKRAASFYASGNIVKAIGFFIISCSLRPNLAISQALGRLKSAE